MGNENGKKSKKGPVVHIPTASEIKTFIMIAQNKLTLFRNKKIAIIKSKKMEIAKSLKENNLDIAKAKMDSLIREEDYITAYDILGPLLEILKERVTYIITSTECPPDLRAQLDTVIYASTRLEFEELFRLRDLIMRKYGSAYIAKAESNADKLVNINLIEKLRIKPPNDAFLIIRLKQLCKQLKIPFEFPCEINSDIPGDIGNPFDQSGVNPYGGGNDFNPYGPPGGNNNNPYGPPGGNDFNPYGPPGGNNNNPYGPPGGNNNNNPYGPPGGNNNNPYGPPGGNYNNPYGPPGGNNNNPYGPPGGNNNNPYGPPGGNNNNLYGPPNDQKNNNNNFGGDFNDYMNKQTNQNNNPNPFGANSTKRNFSQQNYNDYSMDSNIKPNLDNSSKINQNISVLDKSKLDNPYGNTKNIGETGDYQFGSTIQNKTNEEDNKNNDPFGKDTVASINPNQSTTGDNKYTSNNDNNNPFGNENKMDNPFGNDNKMDNPFGNDNKMDNPFGNDNKMDNPFGNDNKMDNPFGNDSKIDNPYSGADNDFPKTQDDAFPKSETNQNESISNPYSDIPQGENPYNGEKSVTDQMFVNPKVEKYNDVGDVHLPTLQSQIKSDNDKPPK